MKLSEVINNNDELYKHAEFENGKFKAIRTSDSINIMFEFDGKEMGVYVPLDGWKEIKPPRQWSEKELMLFKLLPDWANWLSKNADGGTVIHEQKPRLIAAKSFHADGGKLAYTNFFDFINVSHEESPVYIGDLKGE